MTRLLRWTGYILAALLAIVLLAAAWVWFASSRALSARLEPRPAHLTTPSLAQLRDGPRQLKITGCVGCHGEGLRGKSFLDLPGIVRLYAPNLTLIAAKANDNQLEQAIRQGIGHDGRPLLVMPSQGYQFMTDGEVAAIIAAIRALPAGGQEQPAAWVGPRGRVGLALGKFSTAPQLIEQYRADRIPDFGPAFARGRQMVEVNCAECHGPQLKGKELEPGVVSPDLEIAGAYDLAQFQTMLRTGVAPGGKDIGLMGRIARSDFKYLTDEEIAAIHAYLAERARRMP